MMTRRQVWSCRDETCTRRWKACLHIPIRLISAGGIQQSTKSISRFRPCDTYHIMVACSFVFALVLNRTVWILLLSHLLGLVHDSWVIIHLLLDLMETCTQQRWVYIVGFALWKQMAYSNPSVQSLNISLITNHRNAGLVPCRLTPFCFCKGRAETCT